MFIFQSRLTLAWSATAATQAVIPQPTAPYRKAFRARTLAACRRASCKRYVAVLIGCPHVGQTLAAFAIDCRIYSLGSTPSAFARSRSLSIPSNNLPPPKNKNLILIIPADCFSRLVRHFRNLVALNFHDNIMLLAPRE